MPYTDPIVFGLLLISLLGSLVYQWRHGLRGGRLAVVTFAMFYGLSVIATLGMHCVDVLYGSPTVSSRSAPDRHSGGIGTRTRCSCSGC
jgi:hypothetical protein